jgi:hypothetical protein
MGGGNINKKKSWDPSRRPNQEKIWKAERQAIEERKRIEEKRKEIAGSRRAEELQSVQDSAKGTNEASKVDWMYAPTATQAMEISPEMEMYLLGNKKASKAISEEGKDQLERESLKKAANSIRQDPLLEIKKRKLEDLSTGELTLERKMRDVKSMDQTDARDKHHTKNLRVNRFGENFSRKARRQYIARMRKRSDLSRDLKY